MKKINITSIVILAGVLVLLNFLAQRFFFRLDLTEGGQYTLSKATKDIVRDLDSTVNVTAYFSEDLPPDLLKTRQDFEEMLVEYRNASKGKLQFDFINPNTSPEKEQEAAQNGIKPVVISVRDKDQSKQQKAFLGAVLKKGTEKEIIPVVSSGTGMEYALSTGIKKISVKNKPTVGILQGQGEPQLQEFQQVYQSLSVLYNVVPADLGSSPLDGISALAIVGPTDSFPPDQLAKLDDFLSKGGNLFIALNRVNGDLQNQSGTEVKTGLEDWLKSKGLEVEPSFVVDAQCGQVQVQQQQGMFTFNTPIQCPYLPLLSKFPEHPITKGLEQVMLPFASPVKYTGQGKFTPILVASAKSGVVPAPASLQIMDRQWTNADFQQPNIVMGGVLEPGTGGKIVLIGDGDFPISGQGGRGQSQDNISLMVNSIDWLSDDTGLIELRTKGVTTRPIANEFLGEDKAGQRSFLKYLNFGLPLALVLLFGFIRSQKQRNLRMQRMQERYAA
ncbi:MAG: hypothetical protein GC192_18310 [Bacteroidetes bacterium]|nr:hypothetical protein [Bacteroidota bacterium]